MPKSLWIVLACVGCSHDVAAPTSSPDVDGGGGKGDDSSSPSIEIELEIVAATKSDRESLDLFPSINDAGVIAYRYSPGLGTIGVFTDTHGAVATIAEFTGPALSMSSSNPTSINAGGMVAFIALSHEPADWVLQKGDGSQLISVAETDASSDLSYFFGIPMINDAGQVAFGATRSSDSREMILLDDQPIVETGGGQLARLSGAGGPSLASSGAIAFVGDRGGGNGLGVFEVVDGQLLDVGGAIEVTEARAAINDRGDVAFLASDGIYVVEGGTPIARSADRISGGPALGQGGAIAYTAILPPEPGQSWASEGIVIVPPNGDAIMVVRTERPLLGSTSRVLGLSPRGFIERDDGYELAFGVQLADNRTVIERAVIHY